MNIIEQYWKSVSPVTDSEFRAASMQIREKWPNGKISRRKARELGIHIYRTAKPCKHGHHSWRWVSTAACIACNRVSTDGVLARHKKPRLQRMSAITRDLMRDAPEMVIQAMDARAAGLTAYRTGYECQSCGKASWRHIDSHACMSCMPDRGFHPAGQDVEFEESFASLRRDVDDLSTAVLRGIEKDMKQRLRQDKRHTLDFRRVLRFVRRHIRARENPQPVTKTSTKSKAKKCK